MDPALTFYFRALPGLARYQMLELLVFYLSRRFELINVRLFPLVV